MGLNIGKWLKGATRIRFDDRTLGNLTKNATMAGGAALGGPAGLALAAAGGAAGQKMLGGSWQDAAGAGLKGAAGAGALNSGAGMLKGALSKGATAAPVPIGAPPPPPVPTGGLSLPSVPNLTSITEKAVDPRGFMSKAVDIGGDVLGFAAKNPVATSGALSALGNLSTAGAQNRMANAQADLLEKQAGETEYDFEQRKRRDAMLAPTWSALGTAIGNNYAGVARNPYLPG